MEGKGQSWQEALEYGKMVEQYVLSRIQKKYPKAFCRDGRHKEWDIYVPEKKLKIEVKSDVYSNKTGNIVVETAYNDRPSGISTSTADFWVWFTGCKLIWITMDQIRTAIKESGVRLRKFTGGTDFAHKTAYLVPTYFIEANSTSIEEPLDDLPEQFNFRER